ncbi:MAG: exosortase/archaeosortase family protein [Bacteroidales bacterium]|nr:exosortase/archaeosortase family protein [Bacteroidales bacterium]
MTKKNLYSEINDFIKKYKLNALREVAIFAIILLVFHFLWRALVGNIMEVEFIRNSAAFLSYQVFLASEWFLSNVLGIDITTINTTIYTENQGYVKVNLSCSGLKQFYQFTILMILYPGPWKHKLWFIPAGLIIIHITNIFRIVGLVIVTINIPEYWHFSHDYIFRPFFYVVMFAMWVIWVEYFYNKKKIVQENYS